MHFSYFLLGGFWIFHHFIQHCFTCLRSDSTVSTTALAVRRSNNSVRSDLPANKVLVRLSLRHNIGAPKPFGANGDADCGSNSEHKLWTRFELPDFFLVRAVSLFTLRTFGAQINWRVISRKVLFDPHRFLSNKSPIHFAGESGKGNTFLNSKQHVPNENGHRSPRSQTHAQQL